MPTSPGQVPLQLASGQNRPPVGVESPAGCGANTARQASATINGTSSGIAAEHFQAVFLTVDEAVPLLFVEGMAAPDGPALTLDGRDDLRLHRRLRGLAFLVRGLAEVAVGNEVDGLVRHGGKVFSYS